MLIRNESLKFICKEVYLKTELEDSRLTSALSAGQVVQIPIAHGEGNYIATDEVLQDLESNNRVIFRYSDREGNVTSEANPNGSRNNIAGIMNEHGNVFGMMPHPERACEKILGSADGLHVFKSLQSHFAELVNA